MNENKFNQLPRYENIFANFKKVLNQYIKISGSKKIHNFIFRQKTLNDSGFENNLIENDFNPSELLEEIKSSYLSRDYLEGEIGLIDGQDQYDGIFNIALYTLMANRLGKEYKKQCDKNYNLDINTFDSYTKTYSNLMSEKHKGATKLISSLFIYKETVSDNDFFYGYNIDDYGNDAFIIDLPVYGQIGIHFGSKETLETIEYLAKQSIELILNKKLSLGQITEEQFNEIKSKADNEGVLPTYTGKLYEYSSSMPLDYCGEKFERAQKDLGLSGKMITDITDEDIKRISENRKYNSRELYYFAIKSDFSKSQLEQLSGYLQERDTIVTKSKTTKSPSSIDVSKLGSQAVSMTSAEDRKVVSSHEDMCDLATITNPKEI